MPSKPSLVFVPGSWHTAETWSKVTTLLSAQDYKCIAVSLPSASSNPSATFLDDVTAVRTAVEAETTQCRDVVVVVHSYGGIPGSSAIKGLTRPKDGVATEGKSGYVIGFVLVASGFAVTGMSFLDGLGGKPPPMWKADEQTGFATLVVDPTPLFYHDLSPPEKSHYTSLLTQQSYLALSSGGQHAYAGWADLPCLYLATTQDRAFPYAAQKMMVEMARAQGGDVRLREVESGHSPMLSRPEETAGVIVEAVQGFCGGRVGGKE